MYIGYAHVIDVDIKNTTSGTLTLGVASYTLDYLFEDCEIEVDGDKLSLMWNQRSVDCGVIYE